MPTVKLNVLFVTEIKEDSFTGVLRMNIFTDYTLSWWQMGLVKYSSFAVGLMIGSIWPLFFKRYRLFFWMFIIGSWIYLIPLGIKLMFS